MRIDLPDQPVPALIDASQIGIVLDNLINNALKYSADDEPWLEVVLRCGQDYAEVAVADHGIGIPAEMQQAIFEPFRRLHVNLGGTGIGLAIVRRTVEAHGGRIWAESEPGKGAMFLLTLPVAEDSAPAVNRATSE